MELLVALGWGLIAGSALVIGALVGWFAKPGQRVTAAIMAFGSGVLISAIAFDLMDEARLTGGLLPTGAGFLVGATIFSIGSALLARYGGRHRKRSYPPGHGDDAAPVAIALGSIIDGIPESIVIGLSLIDGQGVAVATVIAVFLSNVPEGLSSTVGMKRNGFGFAYVFALWTGIACMCGLGSLIGFTVFDTLPLEAVAVMQGIAAGAMLAMIADTMIPEAFAATRNASGLITAAGFLLAFVLSHQL